jgi:thymidylate kinase
MIKSTVLHDNAEQAVGMLVENLFASLNNTGLRYCILHNYEDLPTRIGNDLDIMVDPHNASFVFNRVVEVALKDGWGVLRRIVRRGTRTVFLAKQVEDKYVFVHVDIASELAVRRVIWGKAKYLLETVRPYRNFYVPQPGCEAALAIRGLLVEGTIREKYRESSSRYVASDYAHFVGCLSGYYNSRIIQQLGNLICRKDWNKLSALATRLRRSLLSRTFLLHGPKQLLRFLEFVLERLRESFRPTGLFLVLIGPDGSGKTTIAEVLRKQLNNKLFAETRIFHRYPGFLPPLSSMLFFRKKRRTSVDLSPKACSMSSQNSNRSSKLSLFRALVNVLYYMWDFVLFYIPLKRATGKGKLVIFDRYFYDHLIQPGYSKIPRWLLRAILKIIPSPDLVVYLHNDAEHIHNRKNELAVEEIEEQSCGCESFMLHCNNGRTVDTNRSVDETVNTIVSEMCQFLCDRESRRS